jgi:hypothetical protein
VAIFSYDGGLYFGVTGDYDGAPDVDQLTAGIERGMDDLLTLATDAVGAAPSSAAAPRAKAKRPAAAKRATASKRAAAKPTAKAPKRAAAVRASAGRRSGR